MEYELSAGAAHARATTLGGELISCTAADGTPYLWQGDEAYWPGHAPLLFPVVGVLLGGKIEIDGQPYTYARHGFARRTEFRAAEVTENRVRFVLQSSEATKALYPYAFTLSVEHELRENGFSTRFTVQNDDVKQMEFCIGGHPAFYCPLGEGEQFTDYEVQFEAGEPPVALRVNEQGLLQRDKAYTVLQNNCLALDYPLFDEDALVFTPVHSRRLLLHSKKTGRALQFTFDGFSSLGIWTPPHKQAPFICLEPWCGMADDPAAAGTMGQKPGIVRVAPGESYTCGYSAELRV